MPILNNGIKIVAIIIMIVIVGIVAFYLGKKSSEIITTRTFLSTSSYRCGDGSEFSLIPSPDQEKFHVVPVSNIEKIPDAIVSSLPAGSRERYEGGGVSLFFKQNSLLVTVGEAPEVLTCQKTPN